MKIEDVILSEKPNPDSLPGFWEPKLELIPNFEKKAEHQNMNSVLIKGAFSSFECKQLIELMEQSPCFQSVSIQGNKNVVDNRIGSNRTSIWSPTLSKRIFQKLKTYIEPVLFCHNETKTDWWQGDKHRHTWHLVGISPLLRFMRYEHGGEHYAHYDAGYIYKDDNYRTLKSMVIYLSSCNENEGGATRFIDDKQKGNIWDLNHEDWIRQVNDEEVLHSVYPQMGNVLIFNHRQCHDVEKYIGDKPRIIIRGDLLYQSI